jgi:hypothetical protein
MKKTTWRDLANLLYFWFRPGRCSAFNLVFIAARHMSRKTLLEASDYLKAYAEIRTICDETMEDVADAT